MEYGKIRDSRCFGFEDFVACAEKVGEELCTALFSPSDLLLFPYPNPPRKQRQLSLVHPEDLIILRAAAGRIVRLTDQLLSKRVFSYRLDPDKGCWAFNKVGKAWKSFTQAGVTLLKQGKHAAMCRTDVTSYYPSVSLRRLSQLLLRLGSDPYAVRRIVQCISFWHRENPAIGLPIGPEASAVLGNIFLKPVDDLIENLGAMHLRYGDDVLLFGPNLQACEFILPLLDEQLAALGLERSLAKTESFDNPEAAANSLMDAQLTSLGNLLEADEETAMDAVRSVFDVEVLGCEPTPSKLRWIVRTLQYKNDPHACLPLAQNRELMNIDPKACADYLKSVGLRDGRVVDELMHQLTSATADQFDGLDLHILRALRARRWGSAEAKEFQRIAADSSRRWPIRSWALHAYVRTSSQYDEVMEAACGEKIPALRRAMVVALKGHARRSFLGHAAKNFRESRYAVQWLRAAA